MNFLGVEPLEFAGNLFAFIITVLILFYAFGDNPMFRLTIHIFIGVAAGYVGGVAWHAVVRPYLLDPLFNASVSTVSPIDLSLRLVLVGLLLTKLSPKTAVVGNPATAYLVGIGAATAIGGAIQGTIFPLVGSSSGIISVETTKLLFGENISTGFLVPIRFLLSGLALFGTIATLIYFHFGTGNFGNPSSLPNRVISIIAWIGKIFIAITFGALFGGVYIASLNALIERLLFLWNTVSSLVFG